MIAAVKTPPAGNKKPELSTDFLKGVAAQLYAPGDNTWKVGTVKREEGYATEYYLVLCAKGEDAELWLARSTMGDRPTVTVVLTTPRGWGSPLSLEDARIAFAAIWPRAKSDHGPIGEFMPRGKCERITMSAKRPATPVGKDLRRRLTDEYIVVHASHATTRDQTRSIRVQAPASTSCRPTNPKTAPDTTSSCTVSARKCSRRSFTWPRGPCRVALIF